MPMYVFNAQQDSGSTMCGAFALCAFLGEKGFRPEDIMYAISRGLYSGVLENAEVKKRRDDLEKTTISKDKFVASCVYEIVKSPDLRGFCSPKQMIEFARFGFDLHLKIKTQDKLYVDSKVQATYARIAAPQILVTIIGNPEIWYQGMHYITRSLKGHYIDSGAGFGDRDHYETPFLDRPKYYPTWGPFWIE